MESPPSFSTHSEAPPLSEDSGLLITSGSFSSDSASGWHHIASELFESDFDERSLSFCESTETSERMGGDFFNTVKKGPGKSSLTAIDPPPEFQEHRPSTSAAAKEREENQGGKVNHKNIKGPSSTQQRKKNPPELFAAGKNINIFNFNKASEKKEEQEDDCHMYGFILANKLRKLGEEERLHMMYEIDGLFIKKE